MSKDKFNKIKTLSPNLADSWHLYKKTHLDPSLFSSAGQPRPRYSWRLLFPPATSVTPTPSAWLVRGAWSSWGPRRGAGGGWNTPATVSAAPSSGTAGPPSTGKSSQYSLFGITKISEGHGFLIFYRNLFGLPRTITYLQNDNAFNVLLLLTLHEAFTILTVIQSLYLLLSFCSSQLIVVEEELEDVSLGPDGVSSLSNSVTQFHQNHISRRYCIIVLLLMFHRVKHVFF